MKSKRAIRHCRKQSGISLRQSRVPLSAAAAAMNVPPGPTTADGAVPGTEPLLIGAGAGGK